MRWELFLRWVIIFAVYDASGTEITDPLYTTENFSVFSVQKKQSNMCRLLSESPLNNVLDIISHLKQITVNEPILVIV